MTEAMSMELGAWGMGHGAEGQRLMGVENYLMLLEDDLM